MVSTKSKTEVIEILNNYSGRNPYILWLKKVVSVEGKVDVLDNAFVIEYVKTNKDVEPRPINKIVKLADWYAEKKAADWNTVFIPEKMKIITYLGETKTMYHCYIQYRQSVPPQSEFIPKKAVFPNFLVDDFHNYQVDFDRFDRLSTSKDPNRKLKPHQKEGVQFLLSRKRCVIADSMGTGKLEPVSSLIPTPNGFVKMGDIEVGDYVFGEDGKPHKVLATYPHKNKEIYKVTFSDGTSVDCGLEHLWKVTTQTMQRRKQGWKVLSLKEMMDRGLEYNNVAKVKKGLKNTSKFKIPVCEPVEYEEREYFIDPYVLGICIGDGNLCTGGINISIPDFELETVDNVSSRLRDGYILKKEKGGVCPRYRIISNKNSRVNEYNREIKRLKLNVHGNLKFIPDEYKFGSKEQRLSLLRGLMDSDGSITNQRNKISYSTNSKKLAYDVAELVFSLGGIARVHGYEREKNGKKVIGYHVTIQIKVNPFLLKRKADKYHPTFKKYCVKYIVSAELDRYEDAKCLLIDSEDHTYLTSKNYIVTHNTTTLSVAAIEGNFDAVVIICPASVKTTWKKELMWYVPERDITIIDSIYGKTKPELEKFLGYAEGKSGKTVKELTEEAKEQGKWKENRFVILNYDIISDFYKLPESRKKEDIEAAEENSPLLKFIKDKKSCIIIDESHRLSNMTSGWSKNMKSLVKRGNPDCVFLSTGTPITNDPQNYFNMLNIIEDDVTDDWVYYMKRYCSAIEVPKDKKERDRWSHQFCLSKGKSDWFSLTSKEKDECAEFVRKHCKMMWIAKEPAYLDELRERTSHIYIRREKEDLENVVKKTIHEYLYDLNDEQMAQYKKLWAEYEQEKLLEDPTKELNKSLLEGAIYRQYLSQQMIPHTIELVNGFVSNGEKVVIACCFDAELYALKEHYGDMCVVFNGKLNTKQKEEAKNKFFNDPNVKILIGNIQAAGVGIDLTAASKLVFNDFSFVPADNDQMCDRIHRLNQTKDCDIYYQIFTKTQYERMFNTVIKKSVTINTVIKKEDEK